MHICNVDEGIFYSLWMKYNTVFYSSDSLFCTCAVPDSIFNMENCIYLHNARCRIITTAIYGDWEIGIFIISSTEHRAEFMHKIKFFFISETFTLAEFIILLQNFIYTYSLGYIIDPVSLGVFLKENLDHYTHVQFNE